MIIGRASGGGVGSAAWAGAANAARAMAAPTAPVRARAMDTLVSFSCRGVQQIRKRASDFTRRSVMSITWTQIATKVVRTAAHSADLRRSCEQSKVDSDHPVIVPPEQATAR
ncbi:hypothetical protein GCM10010470_26910 [Saccharopolyspora taberi]|uniref:Uncharacterized protein n=1 Tax=Saccharopolyspora taberi TaxID=60895 RepID=A0ABN3VF86_9PSEU